MDDKGQKIPRIRQIDDFSEYFVNACTTVADKIPVAGVDAITGHVKMWADKILEGREHPEHLFKVSLADGSTLEGVLHEDFRKGPLDLVGKCMDLESAYKQCPVAPAHARYSPFALKNPESGEVEFFFAKAPPFGTFTALGVDFDLTELKSDDPRVVVANKPDRIKEIC